jgi:hypothetical protein
VLVNPDHPISIEPVPEPAPEPTAERETEPAEQHRADQPAQ